MTLRGAMFQIFDFKKYCDLEIRVRGHLRSLQVVPFDRLYMVSYYCSITISYYYAIYGSRMTIWCTVFEIFSFKNDGTLKTGLRVSEGH